MIGRLRGILALKSVESVLIDIQGVGYEVRCPLSVIDRLPRKSEPCTLSIHTHVREDQITLFGFIDSDQRALFRQLTTVSGIGPKLALACLGGLDSAALQRAIIDEDIKRLVGIPGIGKRTAERLVLELRDKLRKTVPITSGPAPITSSHLDDLSSALCNLGYKPKVVDTLLDGLREDAKDMDFEALLREALKRLSS